MFQYGIGGQERKSDNANEAIAEIPLNRTLLIEKLTADPPLKPQMVYNLKTVEEVFAHYQPEQEVEMETEDGSLLSETFQFRNLADFGKPSLIGQSRHLKELQTQADDFQKFVRQLKSNKILKTVLENPEAKAAYIAALQAMITELEEAR